MFRYQVVPRSYIVIMKIDIEELAKVFVLRKRLENTCSKYLRSKIKNSLNKNILFNKVVKGQLNPEWIYEVGIILPK